MLDGKWIHSVSPELKEDVAMWQCNAATQLADWYLQQLLWSLSQVNFTGSFLMAIQHWFRQCPGIARQQVITFKQNRLSYLTPYGVISLQVKCEHGFMSRYFWFVYIITLRWRHNGHDSVSNHQPHACLLNRLFRHRSKKTSKLRFTGLCARNSPVERWMPRTKGQ